MRELICILLIMLSVAGGLNAEVPSGMEELVAPVAFFPDDLLAQVLTASTYPAEVIAASRRMSSSEADSFAIEKQRWSPEVKVLASAPRLLDWMEAHSPWMVQLGNAFLKNPTAVLQAVQVLRSQSLNAGTLVTTADFLVEVEGSFLLIRPAVQGVVQVPSPDFRDWSDDSGGTKLGEIPRNLAFLTIDWAEEGIRVSKPEDAHPWIATHPMWANEKPQGWQHSVPHRLGVLYPQPTDSLDDRDLSFEVYWEPGYGRWTGNFPATLKMPLMRSRIEEPAPAILEVDDLLPEVLPPRPMPSVNRAVRRPEFPPEYVRLVTPVSAHETQLAAPLKALTPRGNLSFCSVASMLGRRLLSVD